MNPEPAARLSLRPSVHTPARKRSLLPAAMLLAALVATAPSVAMELNRLVLRVNDRIATLYDYQERRTELLRELGRTEMDAAQRQQVLSELDERVFREMYEELLMLSRADQLEMVVSDAEVDRGIRDMYQRMGIQTEREFVQALEETGANLERFRERWRDRTLMQQVVGADVQSRLEIPEEELRRYYRDHPEEFRIPEQLLLQEVIVLDAGPLGPEERQQLAQETRRRLLAGEDLDTIIQPHQEAGETSGAIELGWVKPGELATELEEAIWELPAGAVSEPVKARGGQHLVQVLERKESAMRPFAEVSEEILIREQNRRFEDKFDEYVAELEAKSDIVIDPPPEARNFRAASAGVAGEVLGSVEAPASTTEEGSAPEEAPPEGARPPR